MADELPPGYDAAIEEEATEKWWWEFHEGIPSLTTIYRKAEAAGTAVVVRLMALSLRWIEDAERRPRAKQIDLFPRYCCAEVGRLKAWSWGKSARAIRAFLGLEREASMVGVRLLGAQVEALATSCAAPGGTSTTAT